MTMVVRFVGTYIALAYSMKTVRASTVGLGGSKTTSVASTV